MEKLCCHFFSAILGQILFILAGNDDINKSLDEFEIRPDPIRDRRVSCSLASKESMLSLLLVSQLWLYLEHSQVSVYRTIGPLVSDESCLTVVCPLFFYSLVNIYENCDVARYLPN